MTHVGSLPRTPELLDAYDRHKSGEMTDSDLEAVLENAVNGVVARQHALGIDVVNVGEYGHVTAGKIDYGAWWNYSFSRLGGRP